MKPWHFIIFAIAAALAAVSGHLSAAVVPDVCAREECVYAPKASITAQIVRAFRNGHAEGLEACKVRSGSFL